MTTASTPLLSVGLPVYNGLPYLEESLDCILDGEFEDYELIVCDNASTDGTADLVSDYATRDDRIRYVRNETNIGAARNYNKSFDLARGKYFRWAAADDLNSPGAIARCIERLEAEPALALVFPRTRLIDSQGEVIEDYDDGDGWFSPSAVERFRFSLSRWGLSNTMFGVIRTDVLGRTDLQGDYPASDLVMQSDLAVQGPFGRVEDEYYYRRMHDGCTDNLDEVALAQFYNPGQETAFSGKLMRIFTELARVVRRAPVDGGAKRQMWIDLARRANWERATLGREVKGMVRASVRRSLPFARSA